MFERLGSARTKRALLYSGRYDHMAGQSSSLVADGLNRLRQAAVSSEAVRGIFKADRPRELGHVPLPGRRSLSQRRSPAFIAEEFSRYLRCGNHKPAERVFFTGATGLVGVHLLAELLARSSAQIDCLVRCRDVQDGRERIARALRNHGLYSPAFADRIGVVVGDMSQPRLGLSAAESSRITEISEAIFHVGAMVNFIYPYRALRQTNVEGTREIVRMAFAHRTKPVHFVSSTAIWPMGRTRRFAEDTALDRDTHECYPLRSLNCRQKGANDVF